MFKDSGEGSKGSGGRYPLLEAIARKCEPFGIEYEVDDDDVPHRPAKLYLSKDDFAGPMIEDGSHAQFALSVPFEHYQDFRSVDHWAIWSPKFGVVECEVEPYASENGESINLSEEDERDTTTRWVLERLGFKVFWERDHLEDHLELDPTVRVSMGVGNGVSISVGACSNEWAAWHDLVRNPREGEPGDEAVIKRALTLKVEGVEVSSELRAGEFLERLGETALFEIDRASGVGLRFRRVPSDLFAVPIEDGAPTLPTSLAVEYDLEPMSLYRYGRSAMGEQMALLAFLAFYQVLEYYFPSYSSSKRVEALRGKLREIAGDVKESDVEDVLKAIGTSARRLFPEERKQLMNTIARCVDPRELNGFLAGA